LWVLESLIGGGSLNRSPHSRLVFIDLLRGWAVLAMIETHVFNSLLQADLRASSWFGALTFANGLVAPSFLIVSGWVFGIASDRKLTEFRTLGPAFYRQLNRILLVWCLGYALHLPYYSYSRTKSQATALDWVRFYQMDILHCIAFGLLLLLLGRIFIRDDRHFSQSMLLTGTAVVLASPFVWNLQMGASVPVPLLMYLRGTNFSHFPLFPWLGFILLGGYAAVGYQKAAARGSEEHFIKFLTFVGVECILGGVVFWHVLKWIPFVSREVGCNPLFFSLRLGCVLLLLTGSWFYLARQGIGKWLSPILVISRESLLVYVAHIVLLYRVYFDKRSFTSLHMNSLSLSQSLLVTTVLALVMLAAALAWSWMKQNFRRASRSFAYSGAVLAFALYFSY
jgi:uncharacterized membrane protein